jgi:hypothetical protein
LQEQNLQAGIRGSTVNAETGQVAGHAMQEQNLQARIRGSTSQEQDLQARTKGSTCLAGIGLSGQDKS